MMNLYLAEMSAAFPDKKIMLIWDQAGWHKSTFLKVPENIVLKCLPPYSPVWLPPKSRQKISKLSFFQLFNVLL